MARVFPRPTQRGRPLNSIVRQQEMPLHDYNGTGEWSAEAITARYREYAKRFGLRGDADLQPMTHSQADTRWVYPVMEKVIRGIESGDSACAELGIEFISQDASFPFGMVLKSNTARALRRAVLNDNQKERIRRRVIEMLLRGYLPREYREYAKLLRKIGLESAPTVLERANRRNPHVAKYVKYFEAAFRENAV